MITVTTTLNPQSEWRCQQAVPDHDVDKGSMKQTSRYSPDWVVARYDEFGEREWERFARSPSSAVSLHIHTHYLREFVTSGSRVLDVGAGPGRFTRVLAEMGCRVVAADISPVQLELHRKYSAELAFDGAVEDRLQLDICDMSRLGADSSTRLSATVDLSAMFSRRHRRPCRNVCGYVSREVVSLPVSCHCGAQHMGFCRESSLSP